MGNCCWPRDAETARINREMRRGKDQHEELIKLLFLGAGGSGKSTLFKQLRLLHGNGLKDNERLTYKQSIYQNIVEGMKTLLDGNQSLNGDDDDIDGPVLEKPSAIVRCDEKLADYIEQLDEAAPITAECAEKLKKAWKDKGMQQTWENRSLFQLQDSLRYFMKDIDRIAKEGYVPNKDDVMHVRIKTTGIVEENLTMESRPFLIVDVGGQRSERRKWMNCFSGVTGLIFVASLTAYNQVLYEDESVNRLTESLMLFKNIFAEDTFDEACIVLFLNKADLFQEMIKTKPLKECFDDYKGNETEQEQYSYISNLYEKQAVRTIEGKQVQKQVFIHKTCATNTDQMKVIFHAVNQTVIHRMLVKAGLLAPA